MERIVANMKVATNTAAHFDVLKKQLCNYMNAVNSTGEMAGQLDDIVNKAHLLHFKEAQKNTLASASASATVKEADEQAPPAPTLENVEKPAEKTGEKPLDSWADDVESDYSDAEHEDETADEQATGEAPRNQGKQEKEEIPSTVDASAQVGQETAKKPAVELSLKDLLVLIEQILSNEPSGEILLAKLGIDLKDLFNRQFGKLANILMEDTCKRFLVKNPRSGQAKVMLAPIAATAKADGKKEINSSASFVTIVKKPSTKPPQVIMTEGKKETPQTIEQRAPQSVDSFLQTNLVEASDSPTAELLVFILKQIQMWGEELKPDDIFEVVGKPPSESNWFAQVLKKHGYMKYRKFNPDIILANLTTIIDKFFNDLVLVRKSVEGYFVSFQWRV